MFSLCKGSYLTERQIKLTKCTFQKLDSKTKWKGVRADVNVARRCLLIACLVYMPYEAAD